MFALIDKDENGVIDFDEFKTIAKHLKDNLNDDDLLELMHSTHVNLKTSTNEGFTFDEFYQIVSRFNSKWWHPNIMRSYNCLVSTYDIKRFQSSKFNGIFVLRMKNKLI